MQFVVLIATMLLGVQSGASQPADPPVALRLNSFVVAPAHLPPVIVVVKNLTAKPYEGTVRVNLPDGWICSPPQQNVSLSPGEKKAVRFTVSKGRTKESNSYPVEIVAVGGGTTVTHRQEVVCTSAPYFKPQIDGKVEDWDDAIPVTFTTNGKNTTVSTYWNRRRFSILVAVEEDKLIPPNVNAASGGFDAVQLAVAPNNATTGVSPNDQAARYEFLLVSPGENGQARCFQLAEPGMKLAEAAKPRALEGLEFDKAKIAVSRNKGITYYECSIPFRSLKQIKPSEGREFFLSVLVHDPDGTGIRDWGAAAGLFPCERKPLAWSRWQGARWPKEPLFDNKTPWGLCSSKY